MAISYKTPGVYVEEIPGLPSSIAAVETAIPAFIGYTEKAALNGESLFGIPTRIKSIADYEVLFGGAPPRDVTIFLDANNQFGRSQANSMFYLYDSLRLFYANGGGYCYILSVGPYPANVSSATLEKALEQLEEYDEPTMIIGPEAVSDVNGPYEFYKKALAQCNKLRDRVAICDLIKSENYPDFKASVDLFREKIGNDFLKYGAAYGPWVQANLQHKILRRNLHLKCDHGNTDIQLDDLTNDAEIKRLLSQLIVVETIADTTLSVKIILSGGTDRTIEDKLKELLDNMNSTGENANSDTIEAALMLITDYTVEILKQIRLRYISVLETDIDRLKLADKIIKYIGCPTLAPSLKNLAVHHNYLQSLKPPSEKIKLLKAGTDLDDVAAFLGLTDGNALFVLAVPSEVSDTYSQAYTSAKRGAVAITPVLSAAKEAIGYFHFLELAQHDYEETLNESLVASFATFQDLTDKAIAALNILPTSGMIAGVYATIDNYRGVWKAPANVSLNNVIGPVVKLTQEQQAGYNQDVISGKSINLIRSFPGKGTLVWGARTLAGNDNEWRYINVCRFFNFVEESVKKGTEQFVFEPNDVNTWLKVKSLTENFLTLLWRNGALQGAKPEDAFFVAVGLGKTMTAMDILEGRMIVEIGMAVVRPAEFIILRFSHKMAES